MTYTSFGSEQEMLDFITHHNLMRDRYASKIRHQEKIIEMMRDNVRDLLKVIRSQNDSVDLTEKLMEQDFGLFKNLLK